MVVLEIKYALWTGMQLQPSIKTNALPNACARVETTQKKAVKVLPLEYEAVMEEASKHDRMDYDAMMIVRTSVRTKVGTRARTRAKLRTRMKAMEASSSI